jgi:hypothetical protein
MPVSQCSNFGLCINRRSLLVKVVRAKTVSSNHHSPDSFVIPASLAN